MHNSPPQRKSFSKSSFIHNNINTALSLDCCKSCCTAFNPKGKATLPHPYSLFQHMPLPSPQIGYKQTPCTLPPAPKRQLLPPESPNRVPGQLPSLLPLQSGRGAPCKCRPPADCWSVHVPAASTGEVEPRWCLKSPRFLDNSVTFRQGLLEERLPRGGKERCFPLPALTPPGP